MSNPRPLPVRAPLIGAALSALLFSGCAGSASPGVGARVGDETISASRIDSATEHLCTALVSEGQVVPMRTVSRFVVQVLALGSQAEQIAEEYGITPTATYERDVAERTREAAAMPEEVREDYIEVTSTQAYVSDVLDQVGRAKLLAEGFAEPTLDQVTQAGTDVFTVWPDVNGIEVDPKHGLEVTDGQLVPSDTNLSLAVSDEAKAGLEAQPDAAYANSLPSSQRCGG